MNESHRLDFGHIRAIDNTLSPEGIVVCTRHEVTIDVERGEGESRSEWTRNAESSSQSRSGTSKNDLEIMTQA